MILLKKKRLEISKRIKFSKTLFILFSFSMIVFYTFWLPFVFLFSEVEGYADNKKKFVENFKGEGRDDTYNDKYLSHRLIEIDFNRGVTDLNTKKKALANVNKFIYEVDSQCHYSHTDKSTIDFLACANRLLKNNFYYKPSQEVSNNYAKHQSDCDTNTYLMLDVTRKNGIDTYITYAPNHAFLSWRDSKGNFNDWETVINNNEGKIANRDDHDLYNETKDKSYYTPLKLVSDIEDIYHVVITGISKNDDYIKTIYQRHKDKSFISDVYFDHLLSKKSLDIKTVNLIESELKTPASSVAKKTILAYYYLENNDINKAKYYFKEIEMSGCNTNCYDIGIQLNITKYILFKPIFDVYKNYLDNNKKSLLLKDFWYGTFCFFSGIIFASILIIPNKFKIPSK